jgi:hypothetical protein
MSSDLLSARRISPGFLPLGPLNLVSSSGCIPVDIASKRSSASEHQSKYSATREDVMFDGPITRR